MMFLKLAAGLFALITLLLLWRARRTVQVLTLLPAYRWAVAAVLTQFVTAVMTSCVPLTIFPFRAGICLFSATMLLTPFVAVLGARRPGVRAWSWFVVLPLILVLQLSSMTQLAANRAHSDVEISTPAIVGILVVAVMSIGNYIGGRLSMTAVLCLVAVLFYVAPAAGWISAESLIPALAPLLVMLAGIDVKRHVVRTRHNPTTNGERLWKMFTLLYGVVWTIRVMDRVNQFADREKWSVRLTPGGFQAGVEQPGHSDAGARPVDILAWVLKRFADAEWIESHHGISH